MKKICKNCKTEITNENRSKAYSNLCRPCENFLQRKAYRKNPEKKINRARKYGSTERGKEVSRLKSKRMYEKYTDKMAARAKLRAAVRKGEILKPTLCDHNVMSDFPCEGRIEAHHYLGYEGEHWRDVIWLCKKHHMYLHRKVTL